MLECLHLSIFLYTILKSRLKFVKNIFGIFINSSFLMNALEFLMITKYGLDEFLDTDHDALIAKIFYIHDKYILDIDPG